MQALDELFDKLKTSSNWASYDFEYVDSLEIAVMNLLAQNYEFLNLTADQVGHSSVMMRQLSNLLCSI